MDLSKKPPVDLLELISEAANSGENLSKDHLPIPEHHPTPSKLQDIPLFMDSLSPNASVDSNPTLAALQSLLYDEEEDRRSVATNLKQQGNQAWKQRNWKTARDFWNSALEQLDQAELVDEQKEFDAGLRKTLLCNKAAANLELKNHRAALDDSEAALKIDDTMAKAWFRKVKALLALDRLEAAEIALKTVRSYPSMEEPEFDRLSKELAVRQRIFETRAAEATIASKERAALTSALAARNISLVPDADLAVAALLGPSVDLSSLPSLSYDPVSRLLAFPTFFCYPHYAQTDFIRQFSEADTFEMHLKEMFAERAEWDSKGVYRNHRTFEIYLPAEEDQHNELSPKVLYKVDMHSVLKTLLGKRITKVNKGILVFYILPAEQSEPISQFEIRDA